MPLAPAAIATVLPDDTPRLALRFCPSIGFLASPWPIDRIWRANRAAAEDIETVSLGHGGVNLEVARRGGDVEFRLLDTATFAFRYALQQGNTLEAAAEAALAVDASFDLAAALATLFRESALTGFALRPSALSHPA